MFGSVSFNEILLILVLALLIFGPKRLPQIGRTIGKALGEFRRASSELKRTVETEMSTLEMEAAAKPGPNERISAPEGSVERQTASGQPAAEASESDGEGAPDETEASEPASGEPDSEDSTASASSEAARGETTDSEETP